VSDGKVAACHELPGGSATPDADQETTSQETNELVSYGVCFSGVRFRDSAGLTPAEFFWSSSSIKDSTFQLSVLAGCEQGHTFGLSVSVQVPKGMESRPDVLDILVFPLFAPSFVAGFRASLQR
jgi:hypothetical protein